MLKSPAPHEAGLSYFSLLRCRTAARRRRASAIVLHRPIAAGRRAAARVMMVMMHRLARIRRVGARTRAGAGIRTGAVRLIGAGWGHGRTGRPVVGRTGGRRAAHLLIARGLRKAGCGDRGCQGKRATEYKSAIRHKGFLPGDDAVSDCRLVRKRWGFPPVRKKLSPGIPRKNSLQLALHRHGG
jgi:hypothetical protein